MILVTGAAGKTGRAIIQALASKAVSVRAFVRRSEQISALTELGVKDVIVGDMAEAAIYRTATQGVTALYHICPNMRPDEVALGQIAMMAAQEAGVERFVYHSVLHPHTEKMPHHWHKFRTDELLFESGLNFTILQPAAYMQNVLAGWSALTEQGIYGVPYPVTTRLGLVDLADVAEVAAKVLTEAGHTGAIYELAGPDVLSQTEVAEILAEQLGRPVEAQQIPLAEWEAKAKTTGLDGYQLETLLKMFCYYEAYDFWGNANVLGWLLGRPPNTFRDFVARVKR